MALAAVKAIIGNMLQRSHCANLLKDLDALMSGSAISMRINPHVLESQLDPS